MGYLEVFSMVMNAMIELELMYWENTNAWYSSITTETVILKSTPYDWMGGVKSWDEDLGKNYSSRFIGRRVI